MNENSPLIKSLQSRFGGDIIETTVFSDEVTHLVKKDSLLDIMRFLKSEDSLKFNFLSDVVGVDLFPEDKKTDRFEVVYHLFSISRKHRIRLKIRLDLDEKAPTVTELWHSANCAEREAYDMFGIEFDGHPDLRRIYLAHDWEGFPLRKDYPLRGYKDEFNPDGEEKE